MYIDICTFSYYLFLVRLIKLLTYIVTQDMSLVSEIKMNIYYYYLATRLVNFYLQPRSHIQQ